MRLLRMNKDKTFSVIQFPDHEVPNYATLSHTWRGDNEVPFQDVVNSLATGTDTNDGPGFDKLYFCGQQAKKDRLQYFWVDTCCIDKSSSAELSEAINSMFRWYQRSSKCYAFLADVSVLPANKDTDYRDDQLRQSRWFTRGWTLQELLAPPSVYFDSREGNLLGDKQSLEKPLSKITGIPISALRGTSLALFSVEDKLSWSRHRQTKREEDRVYSLLGLFDIHIPAMSEIEMRLKQTQPEKNPDPPGPVNKWIVPFERNIRFTGRESELNELQDMLFAHDQFAKAAVSGLGGVGKTQLALELLYRLKDKRDSYTAIWVHATSIESLDQGYYAIAQQLGIGGSRNKEANVKQLVQEYLSMDSAGHWIMVYDNADDIDMWTNKSNRLIDYIPRSRNGRVIFTTRNRKVGVKLAHQNLTELSRMGEDSAVRMLRNLLIQKDLVDSSLTDAKTMAASLCHLPLAIAQAAAYVNENGVSLADYLAVLDGQEEDIIELLSEEFEDDLRYYDVKNPVTTTWLVSFRQIQQRDPLAADYMFFMACIDYKDIPQLLLPPGPSRKKEVDAIGTLTAYSFVARHSEASSIDLHRLVHLTIRNWLRNENTLVEWSYRAVARLEEVFPDHGHRNRAVWRMYLPHARYILDSALVAKDNTHSIDLEWKLALCYYSDGQFDEAETFFREVVGFRTRMLGPEHPDTLKSMAKLALTHHAQSRFQESKTLGVKVMEAQKRVLCEEDPDTLSTMSHLAMTYSDLSQWKEAETLELQTLDFRMRVLGEEHPETLVGMSNLVYLYNCQGWWGKAEGLGKRTTSARKKVLGGEHPETLLSIGNLAHTYNNQGRYEKAEELLTHVVNVRVRTLGKEHPHTLSGMSNLAVSYHNQSRWDEAEALQAHVAAARQTSLGLEHFSTLTSMAHLSSTYHMQGRWAEAEKLGLQIMELRKKVLGSEHHHTLTSMTNLASIYLDNGQLSRAEELGLEVLAIRARVLGMDHTHSLASMEHLAATYKKQGRITDAEDLNIQVAELRKMTVE